MKITTVMISVLFAFTMIGCANYGGGKKCCKGKKHQHKWQKMDTDGDGAVSKAEFDKAHGDKFTAMDANKDGKVTEEEKMAWKKAKHSHGHKHGDKGKDGKKDCPSCK